MHHALAKKVGGERERERKKETMSVNYTATISINYTTSTGCVSESGDFATLFFLVRQHWGGCRYRHFAANFKAF
jgi:hypothetical protein